MPVSSNLEEYTTYLEGLTQADGPKEMVMKKWRAPITQVSINVDNATSGTIAPQVKYFEQGSWQPVLDETGAARVIDVTDVKDFTIENNWVYAMRFVPTSIVGEYGVYAYQNVLIKNVQNLL